MMKRISVALLGIAVIAACSGNGGSNTSAPAATNPPTDGATITISGFSFGDPLTVDVGAEVTVVNEDATPHTWTSTSGDFDSGSLGQGEEFSYTFDEAGQYEFTCSIHPDMRGSITVEG